MKIENVQILVEDQTRNYVCSYNIDPCTSFSIDCIITPASRCLRMENTILHNRIISEEMSFFYDEKKIFLFGIKKLVH